METKLLCSQTIFLLWISSFLSYELWKLRTKLRKLMNQTPPKFPPLYLWVSVPFFHLTSPIIFFFVNNLFHFLYLISLSLFYHLNKKDPNLWRETWNGRSESGKRNSAKSERLRCKRGFVICGFGLYLWFMGLVYAAYALCLRKFMGWRWWRERWDYFGFDDLWVWFVLGV